MNDFRRGVESAGRLAVLSSDKDNVLKLAYPLGDLVQAFLFWADRAGAALGLRGPEPAGILPVPANVQHVPIPSRRKARHGDYLPPSDRSGLNDEQRSALEFVAAVLENRDELAYT